MSTTVRVSDETHARLTELAATTGLRIQTLVDEAIAAYEANQFWNDFTAGYNRLAADPDSWAEVQTEREREAPTLTDDLQDA